MEKKLGVLVGASSLGGECALLEKLIAQENTYTIAVDGGILFFLDKMISPDEWLGDMDSFQEENYFAGLEDFEIKKDFLTRIPTTKVSPIKDDTDMELAIQKALDHGCTEIQIFGGLGGNRTSHTVANIQLLMRYAQKGILITLMDETCKMFVLHNDSVEFEEKSRGLISVLSLSDLSEGVSIKGLYYEYEGTLTNDRALGVSNHFCNRKSRIAVENGSLLIIQEY